MPSGRLFGHPCRASYAAAWWSSLRLCGCDVLARRKTSAKHTPNVVTTNKRPSNRGCLAGQRTLLMVFAMFKLTLEVKLTYSQTLHLIHAIAVAFVVIFNK